MPRDVCSGLQGQQWMHFETRFCAAASLTTVPRGREEGEAPHDSWGQYIIKTNIFRQCSGVHHD